MDTTSLPARLLAEHLLITSLAARRSHRDPFASVTLAGPALVLLPSGPSAPTLAHGSRTACSPLYATRKPSTVTCAALRRGKIHARLRAKARHAKHAVAQKKARGKANAPLATTTATVPAPPRCEDGTDRPGRQQAS